jgi:hypothetical protein
MSLHFPEDRQTLPCNEESVPLRAHVTTGSVCTPSFPRLHKGHTIFWLNLIVYYSYKTIDVCNSLSLLVVVLLPVRRVSKNAFLLLLLYFLKKAVISEYKTRTMAAPTVRSALAPAPLKRALVPSLATIFLKQSAVPA